MSVLIPDCTASDLTENMKKVNDISNSNKKFLDSIVTREHTKSVNDKEMMKSNDSSANAVIATDDTDESKDVNGRMSMKTTTTAGEYDMTKLHYNKSKSKHRPKNKQLKRGNTVKFTDAAETIAQIEMKYKEKMKKFYKNKSIKRNKMKSRVTSNEGR